MGDLIVLLVVIGLPALVAIVPLAVLALGIAAVADLDGNGLVRPAPGLGVPQPAPASPMRSAPADGSLTNGPASRISSVTPSA